MVKLSLVLTVTAYLCFGAAEAGVLRDPTTPLYGTVQTAASNTGKGSLKLQAIMRGNGRARAVISGQTCYLGQKCQGYVLISLTKSSAIMIAPQGDERLELSLYTSGRRETKNEDK
ncbi:MSHA biogenesis protein MshK [Succinimonas amylolytica]|uniref:MSHA biogenesis protein MshK n=1 Tax=Succinimonas amylolytica TaxID=83769 RepID=UPI0023A7FCAA